MLRHESQVKGYAIHASNGVIGTVSDFLFEDTTWLVRWLVVDTGNWLPGRKVLLPPGALTLANHIGHEFRVKLTRQQVKDCPAIDTDRPVSRQMEDTINNYYGWTPYWGGTSCIGAIGIGAGYMGDSMPAGSMQRDRDNDDSRRSASDPHLRSVAAVTGYRIHASDGAIGHVEDVLVDDEDWSINYLVVDTRNWWPGQKVLVSPLSVQTINWADRQVNLGVNRQRVKDGPAYDPSMMGDPVYQKTLHRHHGDMRPGAGP
jgi:sporulation protein YlmC with PRC-barrel domain